LSSSGKYLRGFNVLDEVKFRNILISSPSKDYRPSKVHIFLDYLRLPSPSDVHLSRDAKRSIEVDNAGGGSAISEMFSIDLYVKAFMARKVLLEMEVGVNAMN